MRRTWPVALLLLLVFTGTAEAADRCSFAIDGSTWTLAGDCTTDSSIVVPDGVILDGAHHTIMAVDPEGGLFRGGVIVNGGSTATVINTVISAARLENACQSGADRLRGIYFNGASGVIRGNRIATINKAASACPEGNGIEVRNADLRGPILDVEIADNLVTGFQKTGIVASGNVDVAIRSNNVGPSAAQRHLAANGIQIGAGARALIEGNTVAGNSWDGDDAAGTAILLVSSAPGTVVRGNAIVGNADVGIYVMTSGARVEYNQLTDTGPDGAFDVGIGNYGDENVFEGNRISGFAIRYQNVATPPGLTVAAR